MACRIAVAVILVFLAPNLALALDFEAAQAAAVAAPALRAARAALSLRQRLDGELPSQSGNPELVAAVGPALPGPVVSVTVGAAQSFNLGSLPAARVRAADAERAALAGEIRALTADARLTAASAWIVAWAAREQLRVASAEAAVAADLADAATRAATRSALTAGDAAEAQLYAAEARVAVAVLAALSRSAATALAGACAVAADPPPTADGPLPAAPPAAADPVPERWPAAAAATRLLALAERARANETAAASASTVAVGGQLQLDPNGNVAALATLGLRWAAFDRGQRAQSVSLAAAERQSGQADAAQADALRTLAGVRGQVAALRQVELQLLDHALPAARTLVAARQLAFSRGAGTTFELLRARRALLDLERRTVAATGERAWAQWRLALLLSAAEAQ